MRLERPSLRDGLRILSDCVLRFVSAVDIVLASGREQRNVEQGIANMISLIVENLSNGTQRVTSRISGSTVKFVDARVITKDIAIDVLRAAAFAHEITPGVFNMRNITMNEAAKKVMA